MLRVRRRHSFQNLSLKDQQTILNDMKSKKMLTRSYYNCRRKIDWTISQEFSGSDRKSAGLKNHLSLILPEFRFACCFFKVNGFFFRGDNCVKLFWFPFWQRVYSKRKEFAPKGSRPIFRRDRFAGTHLTGRHKSYLPCQNDENSTKCIMTF